MLYNLDFIKSLCLHSPFMQIIMEKENEELLILSEESFTLIIDIPTDICFNVLTSAPDLKEIELRNTIMPYFSL